MGFQGTVGNVQDSCNSGTQFGCAFLGSNGGTVGNIENSCNGISTTSHACDQLGMSTGQAGNIKDSCNGNFACALVGGNGGSIGSMTSSCNNDYACRQVGFETTISLNLLSCCNAAPNECEGANENFLQSHQCSEVRVLGLGKKSFITTLLLDKNLHFALVWIIGLTLFL